MTEDEIRAIQDEVRTWQESTVKHSVTLSENLARYYKALFGKPACSACPSKIASYIRQILRLNPKLQSMKTNSKYRIKQVNGREQMITNNGKIAGLPMHITNANLTDEIAEQLMTTNYARFIEEVKEPEKKQRPGKANLLQKSVPPTANRTMVDTVATNPNLQELLDNYNKKQLIELLQQNKISYSPDFNKEQLANLLIENWAHVTIHPITSK